MDIEEITLEEIESAAYSYVFETVDGLCNLKESDTVIPMRLYKKAGKGLTLVFDKKMHLLKKLLPFAVREEKRDFKIKRRIEHRRRKKERVQMWKSAFKKASPTPAPTPKPAPKEVIKAKAESVTVTNPIKSVDDWEASGWGEEVSHA